MCLHGPGRRRAVSDASAPRRPAPLAGSGTRSGASGIDVLERVFGRRVGPRSSRTRPTLRPRPSPRGQAARARRRTRPAARAARDRILALAQLLLLVLVAVDLRVADVMADEPVRLANEQHGPVALRRACSIASVADSCTACTSCRRPSASASRTRPRAAWSSIGECCQRGVDSAQWLFSSTGFAGTCQSCARLSDSWNVPMFVAPSPKNASATRGSLRSLNARAAPVICGSPPPTTAFAKNPRSMSYRCIEPP